MKKIVFVEIILLGACTVIAKGADQTTFERVFGVSGTLDPATVRKVKALPPGRRLLIDRDGDGRNDEAWYIDTAFRHTNRHQPLLVRVIDEDGDLDEEGPDLDSDLYLTDWNADGTIDHVVDYQDNDHDNDVDEMCIFYEAYARPWVDRDKVLVWIVKDISDDNLLHYSMDGTYYQESCQYRCHFSGDEVFYQFRLEGDSQQWLNIFEDPFAFYDPDGDGCSELVVRICAVGNKVSSVRYSIDADGDAYGRQVHDYDFSVTAIPGPEGVKIDAHVTQLLQLRGIPTHPVLGWDAAKKFAQAAPWGRVCLTWDEMNANTEHNPARDPHERWEGLLNHKSKTGSFPQIGGPPCSPRNKRVEVSMKPVCPLRLYYDPADHRLHLLGGNEGYIDIDFDLDGKIDAYYTYLDDNQDGIFDRRRLDLDGDGRYEFDWEMQGKERELVLEYEPISSFYIQELARVLKASGQFIDAAKAALGVRLSEPDPVEKFFLTKLESWYPITRLGRRMRNTPAGARYYMDLLRDRLLYRLKQAFGWHRCWEQVEAVYAAGDYAAASELVLRELAPGVSVTAPARFQSFTRRIPIRIDNYAGGQRDNWPVVLRVQELRAVAKNLNLQNIAVVAPDRWIDWLEIPHQVDQIDASVGRELSFLVDVPAGASTTYYIYYSPTGKRSKSFPDRTATAQDWIPPNIGWESTFTAYRNYDGRFDFFGKRQFDHSGRKSEWLIYPTIEKVSYHQETDWGIDALHVGTTSGLGGITLQIGGRKYRVQNPGGKADIKFSKRMVATGPVRAAVEITATNVVPAETDLTVRMLCVIYAEHEESEVRVSVGSGRPGILLGVGLSKLVREKTFFNPSQGCFGAWGFQEQVIGEVGLGLIVPPEMLKNLAELEHERQLMCDFSEGYMRYWIIGTWRGGRRFPVAPTIENWQREMQELAGLLLGDITITIGPSEQLP